MGTQLPLTERGTAFPLQFLTYGTYWRWKEHNEPKSQATFILHGCQYDAIKSDPG